MCLVETNLLTDVVETDVKRKTLLNRRTERERDCVVSLVTGIPMVVLGAQADWSHGFQPQTSLRFYL